MLRSFSAAAALFFMFIAGTSLAEPAPEFRIRIDGKILRKASGKLVLSLSSFEFGDSKEVWLENRKTGEKRVLSLSSVYWDISYTTTLSPDVYEALDPLDWLPFVVWTVPDDMDSLRSRLSTVYEYQNKLRRELGNASLDVEGASIRVSSRLTLNKIEKFHRIAADIAREYLRKARERDEINTYLYPLRIQIGFNPFGPHTSVSRSSPLHEVREIIYWEVHRILTQQFGVDESLVDFVFDSPSVVRRLLPIGASRPEDLVDFYPNVTVGGEAIDCALYLQRQGFDRQVAQLVRLKMFRDDFIGDRLVVDSMVNHGQVVDIFGSKATVTFIPPFMKQGETVFVELDEEGKDEIPVVLSTPVAEGGYTLTAELAEPQVARIRPGMPVRRK
ncbi:MAG: hypothetical protein M0Z38_06395 [Deltaproteobacteria bacterium]|nr:hypothetical protein [Deltaproteobacteria bacterium]